MENHPSSSEPLNHHFTDDVDPPGREDEEREFLERARSGDPLGWEGLHRLYHRKLWSMVHQIVRDEQLAEDVVQETFLKAYKQIKDFRGDSRFCTWLYRIAANGAKDVLRRQARRSKWLGLFSLSDGEDGLEIEAVVEETGADHAQRTDLSQAIRQALAQLSPGHRAVVELRYLHGFSTEETAQILGCKRGTVLSRLHYSSQKLRTLLKDYDQSDS